MSAIIILGTTKAYALDRETVTPEPTGEPIGVFVGAPSETTARVAIGASVYDFKCHWGRARARHPTRSHFYLCRVHGDCRQDERCAHLCWLTTGRREGHALGFREKARVAIATMWRRLDEQREQERQQRLEEEDDYLDIADLQAGPGW